MSKTTIIPPKPADALAATINEALTKPWDFITLTRGDQQLGGLIVVRDVNVFQKVVALINNHCPKADGVKA